VSALGHFTTPLPTPVKTANPIKRPDPKTSRAASTILTFGLKMRLSMPGAFSAIS